MPRLNVVPAYGRKYETIKDALEDWESGKDFRAYPGEFYLSKRDIKSAKTQFDACFLMLPNLGVNLQIF